MDYQRRELTHACSRSDTQACDMLVIIQYKILPSHFRLICHNTYYLQYNTNINIFVTTHIIYNMILTVTTYTVILYRETTIMVLHHTIILHNQVWVDESETLIGNYITYILD